MNKMSFTLSSKEQTKKFNLLSKKAVLLIDSAEITCPQKNLDDLSRLIANYYIEIKWSNKNIKGRSGEEKIPLKLDIYSSNALIKLNKKIVGLENKYDCLSIQVKSSLDIEDLDIEVLIFCEYNDMVTNSSL